MVRAGAIMGLRMLSNLDDSLLAYDVSRGRPSVSHVQGGRIASWR